MPECTLLEPEVYFSDLGADPLVGVSDGTEENWHIQTASTPAV